MDATTKRHKDAIEAGPRTREELRALVSEALRCAAEGIALAPAGKGRHVLPCGTVIERR
jgi:hypothetical protein